MKETQLHDICIDHLSKLKVIREGSAEIIGDVNVFYNPVQEFNRDLSIAVINVYNQRLLKERQSNLTQYKDQEPTTDQPTECKLDEYVPGTKYENGLRILEALSATGLRSIRYAKEISGIKEIIANDVSKQAVEVIERNVKHNKVNHLIQSSQTNAMTLMYLSASKKQLYDCIDLDPYGCPNRFLDGAVQSITDGGLLLVTATDMAVLAGNAPEACYAKYGSVPLRMKSCHEMALRILLHCIESHANRYGKYIIPLLSLSADFYVRVFVRVFSSQAKCKYSMSKQAMIYQCTGCNTYNLHRLGCLKLNPSEANPQQVKFSLTTGPPVGVSCEHCGHKHHIGGPIWSDPLHDKTFVLELLNAIGGKALSHLATTKRLIGVLHVIQEELEDVPLYYTLDKLCCVLKLQTVPMLKFRSALLHAGYRVSFSHAYKNSIKTDAPAAVIWDILRCWSKRYPVKQERLIDGSPLKAILSKGCTTEYNFDDLHADANPNSRKQALSRYQANPTAYWGPGTKATIMIGTDRPGKNFRNQNKKQKQKHKRDNAIKNGTPSSINEDEQQMTTQPKQLKLELIN